METIPFNCNIYSDEQRIKDVLNEIDKQMKEANERGIFLNAVQSVIDENYKALEKFVNDVAALTTRSQEFTMNFPNATITIKIK